MIDPKLKSHFVIEEDNIKFDEFIRRFLEEHITNKKRMEHSISVALLAYKIAKANNLDDPFKYYFAGLFHDIAKDINKSTSLEMMKKYFPEEVDLPSYAYHALLGSVVVKNELNVDDKEVLDAIKYHCTGYENMDSVAKILYASDKIDPLRGFDSKYMIDRMLEDYESGFVFVLNENKIFLIKQYQLKGKDFLKENNKYTKKCLDYYLNKD